MYSACANIRLRCCVRNSFTSRCTYTTEPYRAFVRHPSRITDADILASRTYCSDIVQKFDSPSFTLQTFIPSSARDAYLSIRALNMELVRIPDLVSNPTVGALRMQFWRDNINRTFANAPPKEPVAILLHHALVSLQLRHPGLSTGFMKSWFLKVINTREQYMDNRPYTTLEALESYAENTYSSLLYLTLATLPVQSLSIDHLASHIGKATGIAAVLRGLPLIAFPPPSNHHSNSAAFSRNDGSRQGAVLLPLDVMAKVGVKEEEVLRQGSEAPGLRDAVFAVATKANDHLITAREMLNNLQQGKEAGHDFEYVGEEGHQYADSKMKGSTQLEELERGFGVLMPSVATRLWLEQLEKADFNVFKPELRVRDWKLPWKAFWAFSKRNI